MLASRSRFINELIGSGAVSAADLAHTVSSILVPAARSERHRPATPARELLDAKICTAYRVVVLSKRNNRLIVASADPTDKEAAEKIKFSTRWAWTSGRLREQQAQRHGGGQRQKRQRNPGRHQRQQ